MIVVAIIALVAAIAVPGFMRARQRAQNAKFLNALRVGGDAIETYAIEHSSYPPDVNRGVVPPGLATYLDPTFNWTGRTPIGGRWDWDFNVSGVTAAISVVETAGLAAQLQALDEQFDDGNLQTGRFRQLGADRYSVVIQP